MTGISRSSIYRRLSWLQEQGVITQVHKPTRLWKLTGKATLDSEILERYGHDWHMLNVGKRATRKAVKKENLNKKCTMYKVPEEMISDKSLFRDYCYYIIFGESLRRQTAKKKSKASKKNKRVFKVGFESIGGKLSAEAFAEMIGKCTATAHAVLERFSDYGWVTRKKSCIYYPSHHHWSMRELLASFYPGFHFHPVKSGYVGNACTEYSVNLRWARRRVRVY